MKLGDESGEHQLSVAIVQLHYQAGVMSALSELGSMVGIQITKSFLV